VIAALAEPYCSRVRIVPWGMDAGRFPRPVRHLRGEAEATHCIREGEAPTELRLAAADGEAGSHGGSPSQEPPGLSEGDASSDAPRALSGANADVHRRDAHNTRLFMAAVAGETIKGYRVAHEACRILRQTRADFELIVTFDPPESIDEFTRSVGWCSLRGGLTPWRSDPMESHYLARAT
jgi:hypothetical protein